MFSIRLMPHSAPMKVRHRQLNPSGQGKSRVCQRSNPLALTSVLKFSLLIDGELGRLAQEHHSEADYPFGGASTNLLLVDDLVNYSGELENANPKSALRDSISASLDVSFPSGSSAKAPMRAGNCSRNEDIGLRLNQPSPTDRTIVGQILRLPIKSTVAHSVAAWVERYFQGTQSPPSNFRASVIYSLTADYDYWPVVDWKERELEVRTLFHVDEDGFCNCVSHYASGKHSISAGKDWIQSAMCWTVSGPSSLKSLVVAVQHQLERVRISASENSGQISDESWRECFNGKYSLLYFKC